MLTSDGSDLQDQQNQNQNQVSACSRAHSRGGGATVFDSPVLQRLDGELQDALRLVLRFLHHPLGVLQTANQNAEKIRTKGPIRATGPIRAKGKIRAKGPIREPHLLLLLLVVVLLLLALGDQVVQPAQLSLGEAKVQKLPDEDERQNLQGEAGRR